MMSIGTRLRALRKRKGFSLKQVGDFLKVPYQSVQRYEKDKTELRACQILMLCDFFGVKPSYFFDEDPQNSCIVYVNDHHAEELKLAKDVLESKTHYAKSLEMNIRSFHLAIKKEMNERSLFKRLTTIEALYNENLAIFHQATNNETILKAAEPKKGYNDED